MTTHQSTVTTPHAKLPRPAKGGLFLLAGLSLLAVAFSACVIAEIRERYAVEIVVEDQTWSETSVNAIADALSRLPDGVALDGWQPYADGANFYSNYARRNQVVLVPNQSVRTILHELGHAYQMREVPSNRYAWVFFQTEMREFMAATGWDLLSSDAEVAAARSVADLRFSHDGPQIWERLSNEDPTEDYANSFALYFYDPAELQRLSPARHDFMDDHVARDTR
jgi:hypothetical protein